MRDRISRSMLVVALLSALLSAASPALADDYQSEDAAHPLRIAAYALHPVGVILETVIVRPAHWLVSRGAMRTLFGHTERFSDTFDGNLINDPADPTEATDSDAD